MGKNINSLYHPGDILSYLDKEAGKGIIQASLDNFNNKINSFNSIE